MLYRGTSCAGVFATAKIASIGTRILGLPRFRGQINAFGSRDQSSRLLSLWELWETRSVRFPRAAGALVSVHRPGSFHRPVVTPRSPVRSRGERRRSPALAFEVDGRQVIERRMAARRVIPALDEVKDRGARLGRRPSCHPVQQFALERREEALAHRVIVTVADRAHRRPHVSLTTAMPELNRRVLGSPDPNDE